MSASEVPWYAWLLMSLVLLFVGGFSAKACNGHFDFVLVAITALAWVFSVAFAIVGTIRLIKWAAKD